MYFKRCLAWIGQKMGIGLATRMSESSNRAFEQYGIQSTITWQGDSGVAFQRNVDTESLMWAGMLLRPAWEIQRSVT